MRLSDGDGPFGPALLELQQAVPAPPAGGGAARPQPPLFVRVFTGELSTLSHERGVFCESR